MPVPPLRVAILHYQPSGDTADPVVDHLAAALRENGHEPIAIGVDESVRDLLNQIERSHADLVFNICETFADDYRLEVNVAALLEMARLKYTGSGTAGLLLAQDKILTKQLLDYHEVLTPKFATFDGQTFETHGNLSFPLIVKPAKSDASIGIGVVRDWEELTRQVRVIRKELDDDALAEEMIEGRELYVCVIGDTSKPEILPIVELDFGQGWSKEKPKIADRNVKFGPETSDSPKLVFPLDISDELRGRIERAALIAYRALKLRDYARIDFRISGRTNEPYILEVNPNPYLAQDCEVAMAAKEKGLSYAHLVGRVVESAAARCKLLKPKSPPAPKPEEPAANKAPADSATPAP
ncbi:MAG TPA: ATP-grasp domain-containing protein [Myxococcales bacterium]|jgi:D-alanine-D-alanine ligase|nr:ATP-grasp domain-containing protein [Myxococcales bacterium]